MESKIRRYLPINNGIWSKITLCEIIIFDDIEGELICQIYLQTVPSVFMVPEKTI